MTSVDHPEPLVTSNSADNAHDDNPLPPGNHALEVAARAGIGPLSPLGRNVWHGQSRPCVSCGQLVARDSPLCDYCGQDLGQQMIEKMRAHAGPWYVLEHVRPFPGVSLERIVRQLRRGLITETSIIRGPSTHHQWRFAVETPGICRYFGRCWRCQHEVSLSDTHCPACQSLLSFEASQQSDETQAAPCRGAASPAQRPAVCEPASALTGPRMLKHAAHTSTDNPVPTSLQEAGDSSTSAFEELKKLSAAVDRAELPARDPVWDEPPRIAGIRATWVALTILGLVIVLLVWITQ